MAKRKPKKRIIVAMDKPTAELLFLVCCGQLGIFMSLQ